jgi:hypothetical protein
MASATASSMTSSTLAAVDFTGLLFLRGEPFFGDEDGDRAMLMCFCMVRGPGVSTHAPVTTGVFGSSLMRSDGIGVASTSSGSFSGAPCCGASGSAGLSFGSSCCDLVAGASAAAFEDASGKGDSSASGALFPMLGAGWDSLSDIVCDELRNWLAGAV